MSEANGFGSGGWFAPARVADRGEVRVTVGLDFGTSGTKVVVQFEESGEFLAFAHDRHHAAYGPLVIPTTAALVGGDWVFGADAERIAEADPRAAVARSFKMCLPCLGRSPRGAAECPRCDPDRPGHLIVGRPGVTVSARDLAIRYEAWVLRRVRDAVGRRLNGRPVRMTVNTAAPLDQLKADPDGACGGSVFGGVARAAFALVDGGLMDGVPADRWADHDARAAVELAAAQVGAGTAPDRTTVIAETLAAITGYVLQPTTPKGLYLTVDVGAGTTDVAALWLHRQSGDGVEACYYAARTTPVGMDAIDHALFPGDADRRARRERLTAADPLAAFARRGGGAMLGVIESVYAHYNRVWGEAYAREPSAKTWVNAKDGNARYTLCLVGGGTRFAPLTDRLRRPLDKGPAVPFESVTALVPSVPSGLRVLCPDGTARATTAAERCSAPLLLLAYGLAHRPIDLPAYEPNFAPVAMTRAVQDVEANGGLYAK